MALSLPSPADVRVIMTDTTLTDEQIQLFIDDATLLVEGCVTSLDPARQRSIIKWTAAHLMTGAGVGGETASRTSKKLGDAADTFARATLGAGLAGSSYGLQAIALDPNSCLINIGLPGIATKFVVL